MIDASKIQAPIWCNTPNHTGTANSKVIIPMRNTELKIDDELLFFTKSEDIYKAEQLF